MLTMSHLTKYSLLLVSVLVVGCVTASVTDLNTRSHAPVADQDVQIFLPEDTPPEDCERVALISTEGFGGSEENQVYEKFRQEAGKRGANAVQVQGIEEAGTFKRLMFGTESNGDAIALWCPSISS